MISKPETDFETLAGLVIDYYSMLESDRDFLLKRGDKTSARFYSALINEFKEAYEFATTHLTADGNYDS